MDYIENILNDRGLDTFHAMTITEMDVVTKVKTVTYSVPGKNTIHGLSVKIIVDTMFVNNKAVAMDMRVISGHKGIQSMTPANCIEILSQHI